MESKRSVRRRGVVLTSQGQQKLQVARRRTEVAENGGDRYTLEELSERTGVSLKTITKVLEARSTVDKPTLEVVFQAFEILLDRQDYRYPAKIRCPRTEKFRWSKRLIEQSCRLIGVKHRMCRYFTVVRQNWFSFGNGLIPEMGNRGV